MATTPVQLWSCRWAWCRETLTAKDDLLRHILITHVATAEKVKKKDVPLILRAEQGLSGTASFIPSIPTTTSLPPDRSQSLHTPQRSSGQPVQSSLAHTPPFLSLPSSPVAGDVVSSAVSYAMGANPSPLKQFRPNPAASPPPPSHKSSTSAEDVEEQLTQSLDPETPPNALGLGQNGGPRSRSGVLRIPYPSSSPAMNNLELENESGQVEDGPFVLQPPNNTNVSSSRQSHNSWQERNSSLFDSTVASHPQDRSSHHVTQQTAESQTLDDLAYDAHSFQLQTQAPYFSQSSVTDESQ